MCIAETNIFHCLLVCSVVHELYNDRYIDLKYLLLYYTHMDKGSAHGGWHRKPRPALRILRPPLAKKQNKFRPPIIFQLRFPFTNYQRQMMSLPVKIEALLSCIAQNHTPILCYGIPVLRHKYIRPSVLYVRPCVLCIPSPLGKQFATANSLFNFTSVHHTRSHNNLYRSTVPFTPHIILYSLP